MNSLALIRSPNAYEFMRAASPLAADARHPGSLPKAPVLGLARSSGRGGRGSSSPGRGVAGAGTRGRAPCPESPARARGARRLPASPGLSGAAPPAAPPEAGSQFRSPARGPSPHPGQRCPRGKAGRGLAPASPFSLDSFDPRALGSTSAPGLPGSARGGPGNGPQLISFHHAASGRLETAEPVIAFFRRPCAD